MEEFFYIIKNILNEKIFYLLAGALLALIIQGYTARRRRRKIKEVIEVFLSETIISDCKIMKEESLEFKKAMGTFSSDDIILSSFSAFNSRILRSYKLEDLLKIYGSKKLGSIIGIISNLDHLKERLPCIKMQKFIDVFDSHLARCVDTSSVEEHYDCPEMKAVRGRAIKNADLVNKAITELAEKINTLLK